MINFMLIVILFGAFYSYTYLFEIKDFESDTTEKSYFSPRLKVVNSWNEDFLINGRNICLQTKPYLLLIVLTIPSHSELRNAIRETWTKANSWPNFKKSMSIKTVFLFGKYADSKDNSRVINESMKYGDIVVGNFLDSYRNLTIKVLNGLYWARHYCASAKFIAKIDDDTFINIPLLYKYLEAKPQLNYTIFGYLIMKSMTKRTGKYYVSYKSYPFYSYPPYTTGNMYIATSETFFALLDVAPYQPRIEMEDVFITGILAKIAKIRHRAYPRGMYFPRKAASACEFVKNTKLFSKNYESKDVWKAWSLITKFRDKCK